MSTPFVVHVPGRFDRYLDGSSLMQDHHPVGTLDHACKLALRDARRLRRGTGYVLAVTFTSRNVAGVLADYADTCIEANSDEGDPAEVRAARQVLARLAEHGVTPV